MTGGLSSTGSWWAVLGGASGAVNAVSMGMGGVGAGCGLADDHDVGSTL